MVLTMVELAVKKICPRSTGVVLIPGILGIKNYQ